MRQQALGILLTLIAGLFLGQGGYIQLKALLAQWLLEQSWAATLQQSQFGADQSVIAQSPSKDKAAETNFAPWPWADSHPVGEMSIPALNAHWIVLDGSSGRNLAFAPTHMSSSATVGSPGVSVISAHRDTHFAVLENLHVGHLLHWKNRLGKVLDYQVTKEEVVDVNAYRIRLDSEADDNILLLTTCFPFYGSPGGPLRKVFYLSPLRSRENHSAAT